MHTHTQTKQKPNPGANIVHQPQVAKATKKAGPSPAQFYSRREHAFGGSLSRLNRLASRTELSYLESFSEVEEAEPVIEVENGESMTSEKYFLCKQIRHSPKQCTI